MGSGVIAPPFLTSTLDEGEWSASRPVRFNSMEGPPDTYCTGGWVGLRAGLDPWEKKKISCLRWEPNSGRPACSQSLYRMSYLGLAFNVCIFIFCVLYAILFDNN
jgi:hypothetical protein